MQNTMTDLKNLPQGILETFDPELRRAFQFNDTIKEEEKDFTKTTLQKDKIKVSGDGVFYTVQGEGATTGYPTVFLRLKLCNLRCVWCDAWYTWNPKSKEFWKEGEDWTIEETANKIFQAWKGTHGTKRLVITGGEPLIQRENISQLLVYIALHDKDIWQFELETNGTIVPPDWWLTAPNIQFNCSPKLLNSENIKHARIREGAITAIRDAKNSWFKFVVMEPEDIIEIETDFIIPFNLPKDRIILMPQGVTEAETNMNLRKVVEIAKERGYRIMSRLQVSIWGARRRV